MGRSALWANDVGRGRSELGVCAEPYELGIVLMTHDQLGTVGECGLCGNRALRLVYRDIYIDDAGALPYRTRTLVHCSRCHSLWSRLPDIESNPDYYSAKPIEHHNVLESGNQRFLRVRRLVDQHIGRNDYSILDVGCAAGAHLAVYPSTVRKFGVEPSIAAIAPLRARGCTWLGKYVDDVPPSRRFDVVTALDVVEHLEAPGAFLLALAARVSENGLLVLVTGDIDSISARFGGRRWEYLARPEHCTFYSATSLAGFLAASAGLQLASRTWIANTDITPRYVARFARGVVRELVLRALPPRRTAAIEATGKWRFPVFCNNMLLVFRKSRADD